MIDLLLFSIHWQLLLGLFVGVLFGILLIGLSASAGRNDLERIIAEKDERIRKQTKRIYEIYTEMFEFKAASASESTRADLLAKANEQLQDEQNALIEDYKRVTKKYTELYVKLDALQAAEARKFPAPEELISIPSNGNGHKLNVSLEV